MNDTTLLSLWLLQLQSTTTLASGQAVHGVQAGRSNIQCSPWTPYLAGDCHLLSTTQRHQLTWSDIPMLVVSERPYVSAADASIVPQRRYGIDFHRQ